MSAYVNAFYDSEVCSGTIRKHLGFCNPKVVNYVCTLFVKLIQYWKFLLDICCSRDAVILLIGNLQKSVLVIYFLSCCILFHILDINDRKCNF